MSFILSSSPTTRKRILFFLFVLVLAGAVRLLTFNFMRDHLTDGGWFQYGSYRVFDKQAQDILDGRGPRFWIDDPSRTDLVQYPPAYPWMVAAIYGITRERSDYSVQRVQALLDLLISLVLTIAIAVTAYGWRAAMVASLLVALSPVLAIVGVSPSSDAPTSWFVLGALWLLLVSVKRASVWATVGSGVLLGLACWLRVNPLYLSAFWAIPLLFVTTGGWSKKLAISTTLLGTTIIVVSPIAVRNYVAFPIFTPTGGTIGANLWEGLGETELGRSAGFELGDEKMVERERVKMGLPADFPMQEMWPDGIRRERERTRESLAFISRHPIWYAGVMLHRIWGMVKVAGAPLPYYGTSGINVKATKCLPLNLQTGFTATIVNILGMIQSTARFLLLPLAIIGAWLAWRRNARLTLLLLTTIFYYLVPGTFAHTEIRYVLPIHYLMPIFAALTIELAFEQFFARRRKLAQAKEK